MSYEIGMDCMHLRPAKRLAHTQYCSNDALRRHVGTRLEDAWNMDFLWVTNDGEPWDTRGRATDMGHADFLEGGVDRREPTPSPFTDVEQVWAFDAVKEYGLPEMEGLVKMSQEAYAKGQADNPNQIFTTGYYKTIVSGAIAAFGWDMLLEAAAEQDKFETVLDSFFRLTLHYNKAHARSDAKVFIQHDDMVWTAGPFMHPDFYRRVIFPRYRELWKPVKAAGKKVLFCSDGNFTQFIDDIIDAGADGLIFEPLTSLDAVVSKWGKTHVIVGSKLDCRTLTFGTREQIAKEIDETLKLAFDCPGFMFAVGNHIPSNVPVENALFMYDYLSQRWNR
jgi:uroporphyrinogen decarboxylase